MALSYFLFRAQGLCYQTLASVTNAEGLKTAFKRRSYNVNMSNFAAFMLINCLLPYKLTGLRKRDVIKEEYYEALDSSEVGEFMGYKRNFE